ncbi:MAG: outer membrane beta-barrel protein [Candidatus Aminicenantes bacterium]|nr:outer membrane beta-barrel protein [Candidatus Aminicenantes bacterium]
MKRHPILILAAVLSLAAAARADIYLVPAGTYAFPMDQPYSSRFGAGVSAGWAWNSRFALELGLRFWPVPVSGSIDGLSLGTLHVLPLELTFRGRWALGSNLLFYGEAGAGYAFHSFALDEGLQADWDALGFSINESVKKGPAAHLGVGLEYALSPKMAVDFGIRYHLLRTKGEWSITDDLSGLTQTGTLEKLNFDALTLSLGLKISLFGSDEDGVQPE